MTLSNKQLEKIDEHIEKYQNVPGALLPLMHAIQDDLGFVPEESYKLISKAYNLSIAEIHGFITFYHHFRTHLPGKNILQICRAESCQAMGSENIENYCQEKLGINYVYANTLEIADGKVTGRVTGTIVNGERKAELLQKLATKEGLSLSYVVKASDMNQLSVLKDRVSEISDATKLSIVERPEIVV